VIGVPGRTRSLGFAAPGLSSSQPPGGNRDTKEGAVAAQWTVSIDAMTTTEITDDELAQLAEYFQPVAGALSIWPDRHRVGITMSLEDNELVTAARAADAGEARAINFMQKVGHNCNIVRLEVLTFDEHDADLAQPVIPELVGVAELAELLGVSTQRASELRSRAGFPAPTVTLRSGPVWVRANVEHFAETWARKPGRPRNITVEATSSSTVKVSTKVEPESHE
jgi:hypothetical protein